MTVDRFEIKAVIDDLASNKSPGLDGLSAEHFKFAHSILSELMSTLVSSIVVHGHLPQSMNESVILALRLSLPGIRGLFIGVCHSLVCVCHSLVMQCLSQSSQCMSVVGTVMFLGLNL